jgi:hypothetical protein
MPTQYPATVMVYMPGASPWYMRHHLMPDGYSWCTNYHVADNTPTLPGPEQVPEGTFWEDCYYCPEKLAGN